MVGIWGARSWLLLVGFVGGSGAFVCLLEEGNMDELAAARISNKFPKDCNRDRVKHKD